MSQSIDQLVRMAVHLDALTEQFEQLVQQQSDTVMLLKLGDTISDKPQYAARVYWRVAEIDPGCIDAFLGAAASYWLLGEDRKAQCMLDRAREIDATDPRIREISAGVGRSP